MRFRKIFIQIAALLIACLMASNAFAQTEVLITASNRFQNGYEGKSFKYTDEVILKPGFTVTASASVNWYAKSIATNTNPIQLDANYVTKETILKSGVTTESQIDALSPYNKASVYEYVDDIGRPLQQINMRNSPGMGDEIKFYVYDAWGRQPQEYLLYTDRDINTSGRLKSGALGQGLFYANTPPSVASDNKPYKLNIYDDSPLNQVRQVYGAGEAWHPEAANRSVKSDITTNTAEEHIIRFVYTGSGFPVSTAEWPANALVITQTTDEENHIKRTYKNFKDQVILERSGDGTTWHDTYYVYDFGGSLMFVFPPEAIEHLEADYEPGVADKQLFLNTWVYQYEYDNYGRNTGSKVPGSGWVYSIYDKWDRLVLTQNANQAETNAWVFIKYDYLNRPVITGLTTGTRLALTLAAASAATRYENRIDNAIGYTNYTFPPHTENDLLSITYYDNYSFINYVGWDEAPGSSYNFNPKPGFHTGADVFLAVKEYETGKKIRVLNQNKWINSVTYYDDRYRKIQVITENYLGGIDLVTRKYDFSGKNLKTLQIHNNEGLTLSLLNEFEYDHAGRVLRVYQQVGDSPKVLVTSNTYNELGQLIERNLHSTNDGGNYLQSVDLRYNIRGWLTSINNSTLTNDGVTNNDANDLFGMNLSYNQETLDVNGNSQPLYNGNISAIRWSWNNLKDPQQEKIFKYTYDTWSRLDESYFAAKNGSTWSGAMGAYNETMAYDKNGNILSLNRTGKIGSNQGNIDMLGYTYTGNKLINVHDNSLYWNANDKNPDYGFSEISHDDQLTEYAYDASGNVEGDMNKGIVSVTYNHLNRPERIELENNRVIEYHYDAAGNKLRKIVQAGGETLQTDYVGSIQYVNGVLAFILTDEGRIVTGRDDSDPQYEYFLKDHQGNTRVVFGSVHETNVYKATLEQEVNDREVNTYGFKNISRATGFNQTVPSFETPTPQYAAVISGGVGPAKMLSVTEGDKLHLEAHGRYTGTVGSGKITAAVLASAVTSTFGVLPTGETQTAYNSINGGVLGSPVGEYSGTPKAYLCYFLFSADYSWYQFGYSGLSTDASVAFEQLSIDITVDLPPGVNNGFLYVYVANETTGTPVHFDDIKIIHERAAQSLQVLEASDYYPFGLTINPISYRQERRDDAQVRNNVGFQGQEMQRDFGLNWYQYEYRMHDPAIGRFGSVDPLSEKYYYNSPYAFSENRLVDGIELEGLEYLRMDYYNAMMYPLSPMEFGGLNFLLLNNIDLANTVQIGNDSYLNVGRHMYYNETTGWSFSGSRAEQKTEETLAGLNAVNRTEALPSDVEHKIISAGTQIASEIMESQQQGLNIFNPGGVCYAVNGARINQGFKDAWGVNALNLEVRKNNIDHQISSTAIREGKYAGYGVGGALARNGYGILVSNSGIWNGDLQVGAPLQLWYTIPSLNAGRLNGFGWGHSVMFKSYEFENGKIIGINIIDKGGADYIPKTSAPFMVGANPVDPKK
ncbi:MAG: hypothetical protein JNK18_02890 [Cyclobacteriaceae bacterium]|nr:hypothetical protein [Cyclobacteriaceae bacterium]